MGTNIPEWQGSLNTRSASASWVQLRSTTVGTVTVLADSNGQFLVTGIPSGTYTLWTAATQVGPWTQQDSNYVIQLPAKTNVASDFFASNPAPNTWQPFADMAASGTQVNTEPTIVSYFPAGAATYTHTGDTLFADVDATNLIATVVIPPSGRFFVELSAAALVSAGLHRWGLADANGNLTESQQVVANDAVKKRYTAQMVITKDSAGVALAPGATMTIKWRFQVDNGANTATIAYGGAGTATPDGPATMKITPGSNRITIRPFTTALIASPSTGLVPMAMSVDGTTMVGTGSAGGHISRSTDEGATWGVGAWFTNEPGAMVVGDILYMYDGELLILTTSDKIYRTSGWASNPATATFNLVLTAQGGSGGDVRFAGSSAFNYSTYGKIVVVNEYFPKVSQTDMARYCYLSVDGGLTWRVIFDLYAQMKALVPSWDGTSGHLHGAAYDPWWDAIWLTNGDTNGTVLPVTWLSFDRGATWQVVYSKHQFTSILPLPNCVLFGTDYGAGATDGGPNGIYRIPRGPRDGLNMQIAGTFGLPAVGAAGNPSVISWNWRRHHWIPDAPAFLCFVSTAISTDQLWVTYDGYTFKQIWLDTGTTSGGIISMVGPTASGLYRGGWQSGATFKMLTVTPA